MSFALLVQVLLNPVGQVLHRQAEVLCPTIYPFLQRGFALPNHFIKRGHHLVSMKLPGVAFLQPRQTRLTQKGLMEIF